MPFCGPFPDQSCFFQHCKASVQVVASTCYWNDVVAWQQGLGFGIEGARPGSTEAVPCEGLLLSQVEQPRVLIRKSGE
ncbi:hypothetical protein AVEN_102380-1 [Araneus ventricosus]|uniref:Uncharacterized protein n=1 Tax=Araneus ventricosus TaxID=182803 RepID=A0A4Y2S6T8_ARAVE|nr:hypothetical protein AVEN_102380-1 [Araneus ventricosus]